VRGRRDAPNARGTVDWESWGSDSLDESNNAFRDPCESAIVASICDALTNAAGVVLFPAAVAVGATTFVLFPVPTVLVRAAAAFAFRAAVLFAAAFGFRAALVFAAAVVLYIT
jgi:hypothetical protein